MLYVNIVLDSDPPLGSVEDSPLPRSSHSLVQARTLGRRLWYSSRKEEGFDRCTSSFRRQETKENRQVIHWSSCPALTMMVVTVSNRYPSFPQRRGQQRRLSIACHQGTKQYPMISGSTLTFPVFFHSLWAERSDRPIRVAVQIHTSMCESTEN